MAPDDVYYSDTRARNIFGFSVEDDSMAPAFRKGDVAVTNPNLEGRPGDYVVAVVEGKASLIRMEALPDPGLGEIVGRVVERKRIYR